MKNYSLATILLFLSLAPLAAHSALEMSVFEGYASSRAVLSGRYEEAISIASTREKTNVAFHRVVNATALCVALVKTNRIDDAATACERAEVTLENIGRQHDGMGRDQIVNTVMRNQQVITAIRPTLAGH
ncbi:MAG: hypothetical protein AB8B96_06540 [Lysobacterales bacterium]